MRPETAAADAAAPEADSLRRQRRERLRRQKQRTITGLDQVTVRSLSAQEGILDLHFLPAADAAGLVVPANLVPERILLHRFDEPPPTGQPGGTGGGAPSRAPRVVAVLAPAAPAAGPGAGAASPAAAGQPVCAVKIAGEHLDLDPGPFVLVLSGLPDVDRFLASAAFLLRAPGAAPTPTMAPEGTVGRAAAGAGAGAGSAGSTGEAGGGGAAGLSSADSTDGSGWHGAGTAQRPRVAGPAGGGIALMQDPTDNLRPLPVAIGYLNKDFDSFRRLMLSHMAARYPQWEERNPVDLGVAIVEILAYAGDMLSYYQDALGAEAYLGTARRRVSVRRHARLVDYTLHEGSNARTWLQMLVAPQGRNADGAESAGSGGSGEGSAAVELPAGTQVLTGGEVPCRIERDSPEYTQALAGGARVFETMLPAELYPEHNEIPLYAWGVDNFQLPAGATSATLAGSFPRLRMGQVLMLWEARSPRTGEEIDRDPRRCWPVRLSTPPRAEHDSLDHAQLTDITWHEEDALPFPLWISRRIHGRRVTGLTVACGNQVLADQGQTVMERLTVVPDAQAYRPYLKRTGLTWAVPLPSGPVSRNRDATAATARAALEQDPNRAMPAIVLHELGESLFVQRASPTDAAPAAPAAPVPAPAAPAAPVHAMGFMVRPAPSPGQPAAALAPTMAPSEPPAALVAAFEASERPESPDERMLRMGTRWPSRAEDRESFGVTLWRPSIDLLAAGRFDRRFVVEVETDGRAYLRFGDGTHGWKPAAGSRFMAVYRVGNGAEGNVGVQVLTQLVSTDPRLLGCINRIPAFGGTAPEELEHARLAAPQAVTVQERCVISADYEQIAGRHREVRAARAVESWSGSWSVTTLYVQRAGGLPIHDDFLHSVASLVRPALLATADLRLRGAVFVPLQIEIAVEVAAGFLASQVERQTLQALGDRAIPGGPAGYFFPDNFTFGQAVYLGSLLDAARRVPGVAAVEALVFKRLGEPDTGELMQGQIAVGACEIVSLRSGPSAPGSGPSGLRLRMLGGQ